MLRVLLGRDDDAHGPLVPLLVGLTFMTGVVDAVSYLRLGHVFVANMTGNVVFLGFAIAGAKGLSIASSLIALSAFLIGASFGGSLTGRLAGHRGHLLRGAGVAQLGLVVAALLVSAVAAEPTRGAARYSITALLAVSMGIQNTAAGRLAVPELTTTVLTKTLTGLASDAGRVAGRLRARRIASVVAMALGALAGALLALRVSVPAALTLASALAAVVVLAVHIASRGGPVWTVPRGGG